MLDLDLPIERGPIHLVHQKVAEDQIVDIGTHSFERFVSIRGRLDFAGSSALNVKDNELTKVGIVVNDQHAGAFKAPRMDVSIWPSISRLALGEASVAYGTDRVITGHRMVEGQTILSVCGSRSATPWFRLVGHGFLPICA
jgi:hypothetical protein